MQPISPEALVHIAALVERDNIGLPDRCAHYRRRASLRRTAVAAVALVVLVVALSLPQRTDTFVDGSLQCCAADACDRVNIMLAKI